QFCLFLCSAEKGIGVGKKKELDSALALRTCLCSSLVKGKCCLSESPLTQAGLFVSCLWKKVQTGMHWVTVNSPNSKEWGFKFCYLPSTYQARSHQ
ncbi:hypothetical protein Nmel_003913, partial [Mimus melanotis]